LAKTVKKLSWQHPSLFFLLAGFLSCLRLHMGQKMTSDLTLSDWQCDNISMVET
jgi:hypothetical protein